MSENDYLAAKLVQLFWAWDLPLVCWWLEDLCKHSFAWDSNCIARSRELYIHDFSYGSACFFLSRSIRQNDPLSGKVVVLLWSVQSCWFSIEMITNGNMTESWFMGGAATTFLWRVHMSRDGCCFAEILRCVGASQETTVKERVAFLRMAEEGDYAKTWGSWQIVVGRYGLNWLHAVLASQTSEQPEVCWLIWGMWIFKPWRVPWPKTTTSESMRSFVREVRLSGLSLWRVDSARLFGSFIRSSLSLWLLWRLT